MGLTGANSTFVTTFLAELDLLGLEGPFRASLLNVELKADDPRAYAIAGVLTLLRQQGLESYQLQAIQRYLVARTDEQLVSDLVYVRDGAQIVVPHGDDKLVLDIVTLAPVADEYIPLTITVTYPGRFLAAAKHVLASTDEV